MQHLFLVLKGLGLLLSLANGSVDFWRKCKPRPR